MSLPSFPAGFRFGVSTSAFQIEGGADADGKGPSIWDTSGAPAGGIDHYRLYESDVLHVSELGVQDYRFSISWPRVLPLGVASTSGRAGSAAGSFPGQAGSAAGSFSRPAGSASGWGKINEAGLDFYDRLVDRLLAAGVRPVPTLYHWDLPQALEDEGGWLNRDTAHAFAEYAAVLAERLGDRVKHWITLNEMNVHTLYGYALTDHAPARGLGLEALPAAHHQLLGHGLAVQVLRAYGASSVGVAMQHFPVSPASTSSEDVAAAALFSTLTNWTFADPILRGSYPPEVADAMPVRAGDLDLISAPLDFYGVNYYEPVRIEAPRAGKDYSGVLEVDIPAGLPFSPVPVDSPARTDFGWPIVPGGLSEILRTLHDRYPNLPPVVITENGASFHDTPPGADGRVPDPRRIDYLAAHLSAVAEAITAGVDVRGYYVWSLFDNLEWAAGYRERFGLVYVDHATQARTRKDSWYWLRDLIASLT